MSGTTRIPACFLTLVLVTVTGSSACRSSPETEKDPPLCEPSTATFTVDATRAFAEAEALRARHTEASTRRAVELFCRARAVWLAEGASSSVARASREMAVAGIQLGSLSDGLRAYLDALSHLTDEAPGLQSEIWSEVGVTRATLANSVAELDMALSDCERASRLAREAGGARERAKALGCYGEVEYHRGNLEEALELHAQAESLWAEASDPRGEAERLFYVGTIYSDLSRFEEALECFQRSLDLWDAVEDVRGRAITLVAMGRLEHRKGHYQEALNHFRSALGRLEFIGDSIWEASGIAGIGAVYYDMANVQQAVRYWETALERYRRAHLHTATLDLLTAVGRARLQLAEPEVAIERFREALALAAEIGSERWQAFALRDMGLAYRVLGRPHEALFHLRRAQELQPLDEDPRMEAEISIEMGNAFELLGDTESALDQFRRAVELSRASVDRRQEAAALYRLAATHRRVEDLASARRYVEMALEVADSLRSEVQSEGLRTSYFAAMHDFYELEIDVLMGLHLSSDGGELDALAFRSSERARARSLLESLEQAGVDVRSGVGADLLQREHRAKRALDDAVRRRFGLSRDADPALERELDEEVRELDARYDLVLAEIRSKSRRYADANPATLDARAVQNKLLDENTLLLEYALGENQSFLWVVSTRGFDSFELPSRRKVEDAVQEAYRLLTARTVFEGESLQARNRRIRDADTEYWKVASRLSDMLLGPIAGEMGRQRLLIVADGALQYLPFSALPIPGREGPPEPLIVEHEIVHLPSASVVALLRSQRREQDVRSGTVAVFADPVFSADDSRLRSSRTSAAGASGPPLSEPDSRGSEHDTSPGGGRRVPRLRETLAESDAIIAAAPPGTTFRATGFDASRDAAMDAQLSRYQIVHFATHGIVDDENPAVSGLVLSMFDEGGASRDGFLRLRDIYDMRLPVEMIVLSACDTALGRRFKGEGLVGIVRAFMYAGAERVVASLWKVEDEATRELMSRFYDSMFEHGSSPTDALRHAQIAMWRDARWRPPFYWASFVLQGEWRGFS